LHPRVALRVGPAVDHVESAGRLAVGLPSGRLARLERSQQPLPQREIGTAPERVEHRVGDFLADYGIGGDDHVAIDAMTRPRPVAGARAAGAEAAHVEPADLPALDEPVARRDLA